MKSNRRLIIILCLIAIIGLFFNFTNFKPAQALTEVEKVNAEINDLNQKIADSKKKVEDLQKQQEYYQKNLDTKRKEINNLSNQISILENSIDKMQVNIKITRAKVNQTNLEIINIGLQIQQKEKEIIAQKEKIAEIIRLIYQSDQQGILEIILNNHSLSEFFDQIKYTEDLQKGLQNNLDQLQVIEQGLLSQKTDLNGKKTNLENLKSDLETQNNRLTEDQGVKKQILTQTKGAEAKYQSILYDIQRAWNQANNDINSLEKTVREKLSKKKELDTIWTGTTLAWPVPSRVITTSFHDPDYPFRRALGEHPAIDIRAPQGTPVKAAADGYVARAKNAGLGYNYIMLIHNQNMSTVYGHLSKLYVSADTFIKQGQVIGLSGGIPGTPGAGPFCTGPHLHFEVRLNGIPVNPVEYLK